MYDALSSIEDYIRIKLNQPSQAVDSVEKDFPVVAFECIQNFFEVFFRLIQGSQFVFRKVVWSGIFMI